MENLSVRDILKLSEYDRLVYLLKKKEYQKDSLYSWALNVFKTDEAGYEENGTLIEFGTVPMLQEEVNRLKSKIKALGCEVPSIESEIL